MEDSLHRCNTWNWKSLISKHPEMALEGEVRKICWELIPFSTWPCSSWCRHQCYYTYIHILAKSLLINFSCLLNLLTTSWSTTTTTETCSHHQKTMLFHTVFTVFFFPTDLFPWVPLGCRETHQLKVIVDITDPGPEIAMKICGMVRRDCVFWIPDAQGGIAYLPTFTVPKRPNSCRWKPAE